MAIEPILQRRSLKPISTAIGVVGYLGRMTILFTSALRASLWSSRHSTSIVTESSEQLERILAMGLAPVAIVHVGLGSFLAMQAYFGATFVDGIGPVVGVGLIRNLAPLMTGLMLAGLLSARYVAEFRRPDDHWPEGFDPPRKVASRLAASMMAGVILSAWGSLVGISVGYLVARSMMGMTFPAFFDLFVEMLWTRDVIGLVVKGVMFGLASSLFACHEGLTDHGDLNHPAGTFDRASCRAAYLAGLSILFINSGWFLLVYHAGPAFGPTVLSPPNG